MKEIVLPVVAVLLLLLFFFWFLLPSQVVVSKKLTLHASQNAVVRLLTQKEKWKQWWPANQTAFVYDSLNFSLQQQMLKTVLLHVPSGEKQLQAQLNTVYYDRDSSAVLFGLSLPASTNPFEKLRNYFEAKKIATNADNLLQQLKAFAEKGENIYGMAIRQERVKDSSFVAIRFETLSYPDTKRVYEAVQELKNYISSQGAKETNAPMLHVDRTGNEKHDVMVAIPVDRVLSGNGKIVPKRMVLGNILVADVKGGTVLVEKALKALDDYVNDHRRTSPAIPYQSLVTDRQKEPDTTKWITRLYYPVI